MVADVVDVGVVHLPAKQAVTSVPSFWLHFFPFHNADCLMSRDLFLRPSPQTASQSDQADHNPHLQSTVKKYQVLHSNKRIF